MTNPKRNLTREEGLAMVSRFHTSGMTQAKFAQAEGQTKAAVQYWIRKVREEGRSSEMASPFHFVEVVSRKSRSVSCWQSGGATMELAAARIRFDTLPPAEYVAHIAVAMAKGLSC